MRHRRTAVHLQLFEVLLVSTANLYAGCCCTWLTKSIGDIACDKKCCSAVSILLRTIECEHLLLEFRRYEHSSSYMRLVAAVNERTEAASTSCLNTENDFVLSVFSDNNLCTAFCHYIIPFFLFIKHLHHLKKAYYEAVGKIQCPELVVMLLHAVSSACIVAADYLEALIRENSD